MEFTYKLQTTFYFVIKIWRKKTIKYFTKNGFTRNWHQLITRISEFLWSIFENGGSLPQFLYQKIKKTIKIQENWEYFIKCIVIFTVLKLTEYLADIELLWSAIVLYELHSLSLFVGIFWVCGSDFWTSISCCCNNKIISTNNLWWNVHFK